MLVGFRCGVWGSGFRVHRSEFRVHRSEFTVQSSPLRSVIPSRDVRSWCGDRGEAYRSNSVIQGSVTDKCNKSTIAMRVISTEVSARARSNRGDTQWRDGAANTRLHLFRTNLLPYPLSNSNISASPNRSASCSGDQSIVASSPRFSLRHG